MLLAFYKPKNVLGRHPIGVMNWVSTFIVGLFTLDMVVKTWMVSIYPETYLKYVKDSKKDVSVPVEKSSGVAESKDTEI